MSVLQWLCNADRAVNAPIQRLARFFNTLFASLRSGARAIFQFYPESDDQVTLIMSAATKAGFTGGLVVDYPNSRKAKKFYLCLMSGVSSSTDIPRALGTDIGDGMDSGSGQVAYENRREQRNGQRSRGGKKPKEVRGDKDWILRKKSLYRQRGKEDVPTDSKYVCDLHLVSAGWLTADAITDSLDASDDRSFNWVLVLSAAYSGMDFRFVVVSDTCVIHV